MELVGDVNSSRVRDEREKIAREGARFGRLLMVDRGIWVVNCG